MPVYSWPWQLISHAPSAYHSNIEVRKPFRSVDTKHFRSHLDLCPFDLEIGAHYCSWHGQPNYRFWRFWDFLTYELQTWYTGGVRTLLPQRSAIITKVKVQGRDVTWCVWQVLAHKSRTKSPYDGLPSSKFWASYRPFRSRVMSRHATERQTVGRTDIQPMAIYNAPFLWGGNIKSNVKQRCAKLRIQFRTLA